MEVFEELAHCVLCEHRCGVDRLAGETGVCRATLPVVASAQLHPAPPSSYTVFMAGCNFTCLNCQNWTISCYPERDLGIRGQVPAAELAAECVAVLHSVAALLTGADRIFFSGGAADIHLPYVEEVVRQARLLDPDTRVNFDTNGYLSEESLKRVLAFTTSVTFDIKAVDDEVHRALTGASSAPVLRNAETLGRCSPDKLWEYRILVIPGITDGQVAAASKLIADIDPDLPVCLLAFRPNFVLEHHPGAAGDLMEQCLATARRCGLRNVHWSGLPGLPGTPARPEPKVQNGYRSQAARLAAGLAEEAGCITQPRSCSDCAAPSCQVKRYLPARST
jgi:pyruvate formate lyase activating enzyme